MNKFLEGSSHLKLRFTFVWTIMTTYIAKHFFVRFLLDGGRTLKEPHTPPCGGFVLHYNTRISNQRMDFIKRLFIYLLLCFLVGKVVAEDIKTRSKDDLTDFIPAQSIIFFQ